MGTKLSTERGSDHHKSWESFPITQNLPPLGASPVNATEPLCRWGGVGRELWRFAFYQGPFGDSVFTQNQPRGTASPVSGGTLGRGGEMKF